MYLYVFSLYVYAGLLNCRATSTLTKFSLTHLFQQKACTFVQKDWWPDYIIYIRKQSKNTYSHRARQARTQWRQT